MKRSLRNILKKGLKIQIDGDPYVITDFEFCKPGKGTALYRCRMKNMITGAGMEKTYRPTDKIDEPDIEEREMYYSYNDGHNFVFSDPVTYEELSVGPEVLGDKAYFLLEESLCNFVIFNGEPIEITLPTFIEKGLYTFLCVFWLMLAAFLKCSLHTKTFTCFKCTIQ